MNVCIAGGGRVGFHLAQLLSLEQHDITVIEADRNRYEQVDYALDIRTLHGNAASVMLLEEAGVADAELFVSVTGSDEVNLIAGAMAKGIGAKQVVARVADPIYLESNILYEATLGIDYLLTPDALTALEIVKYIETPGMVAAEEFGRGRVQMRQMRIARTPTGHPVALKDLTLPPGVLVGMVSHEGSPSIPHGDTLIEPGDLVTLVGEKEPVAAVQKMFRAAEPKAQEVIIMGGGEVGAHLAQVLENRQPIVRLFDLNNARCKELAAKLSKTQIVCCDATRRAILEQENAGEADVFVATTNDDERNIMASLLARDLGVTQIITVVHEPDFAPMVRKLGIDHAVTPRACIANRIMRLVHQKTFSSLAMLEEGQIEILELAVGADSPITGKPLNEVRFPKGLLVATILRGGDVIVPRGNDELRSGDTVILITSTDSLEALQKLLEP